MAVLEAAPGSGAICNYNGLENGGISGAVESPAPGPGEPNGINARRNANNAAVEINAAPAY